jgi:hypothetical protein
MINKSHLKTLLLISIIFILSGCSNNNKQDISENQIIREEIICTDYNEMAECTQKTLMLNFKINYLYSNRSTILQNYYNIEKYIKNNNLEDINNIQYIGYINDNKIISFNVNKELISKIKNKEIIVYDYEDELNELWISNELKN